MSWERIGNSAVMEWKKKPVASASEPENKRDEYQGCSHVETVPQRINDKMNEQAKGMTRLLHR